MIKLQTVEVVSVTTAFLLKLVVELHGYLVFPPKRPWFTRVHYVINLEKVVLFII